MRRLVVIALAAVAFAALARGSAAATQERRIEAEGRAALAGTDPEKARQRAVEYALRAAVEQGVGTFVSTESASRNYQLVSDRILTQAAGYVADYRIVGEKAQGDFYVVTVSAVVKTADLERDLRAIGIVLERKRLPRVMVIVDDQEGVPRRRATQAESTLASAFNAKGFTVIDPETAANSRRRQQVQAGLRGDYRAICALAQAANADVVVLARADSGAPVRVAESNFVSVMTDLSLRVVNADTAELLAARNARASGMGLDETTAASDSVVRASAQGAEQTIADVLGRWRSELGGRHTIELVVTGVSNMADLAWLEGALENAIPGVQEVYRRSFQPGQALLDVSVRLEADSVASAIQRYRFGRLKVIVVGFTKNQLTLRVQPGTR